MPSESSSLATAKNPGAGIAGRDRWIGLTRFTPARIALGRTGGSLRTEALLDFRVGYARARDAVQNEFNAAAVEEVLRAEKMETFRLATLATERRTYLARPDLGRQLSENSRRELRERVAVWGKRELAIIVSDGLSALAAERNAVPLLVELLPLLRAEGWTIYPVFVTPFARVKLQDEVGELLGARHALMLIGERPGLSSPDSLGAYFTFRPCAERTDADRNCVSNIRPEGLPPAMAAQKISLLLTESARRGVSGIGLKDVETEVIGGL
jgi:ethanolamine ammonia-lyase small subunit